LGVAKSTLTKLEQLPEPNGRFYRSGKATVLFFPEEAVKENFYQAGAMAGAMAHKLWVVCHFFKKHGVFIPIRDHKREWSIRH